LTTGGTEFLASVIRLDDEAQGWPATYLALATPAATFTGFIVDATRQSALISILIFLLATPAIVWAARRIARPLTELESAAENIAQLDLTRPVDVSSRIREIASLGQSFGTMQNALGQIAKFVPKAVVQQLIRSRTRMDVGGERRELSFMFSDVRDFTPMAEALPAEELMSRMSTYLETLVREILAQGGTVDKYVGDAIFAFWNAPVRQENHVVLACEAALACQRASNTLNAALERQGKQPWYTRFSVHVGEAVVGNVGSSDRLDYTAIGNAVNMASRLEGLNKHYGTQILVSDAVVARAGDRFLFRPLDRVLPKGATQPVAVFELISRRDAAGAEIAERCRKWTTVCEMYQSGDWAGARAGAEDICACDAGDTVAAAFKTRMASLPLAPPADWDGTTHFGTK
jgi:adenylate cyclase